MTFTIEAAMQTYHVYVFTGDKWGAGTDANVYVVLFGDDDDTGQVWLKTSKTNKNKFERKKMDEFVVEAVDIGDLKKIKYDMNRYIDYKYKTRLCRCKQKLASLPTTGIIIELLYPELAMIMLVVAVRGSWIGLKSTAQLLVESGCFHAVDGSLKEKMMVNWNASYTLKTWPLRNTCLVSQILSLLFCFLKFFKNVLIIVKN